MHRRVIYQALAWAPVIVAVAGDDTARGFVAQSPVTVTKTVIYQARVEPPSIDVTAVAETITADKWHQPLATPTRLRRVTAEEGSFFVSPPAPQANDLPAWYRPLDWPTRLKRITAEEGTLFAAPPRPEAKDQVAWWYELARPVRLKRLPVTAGSSFVAAAPSAGTEYNWFNGLDTPTRLKRSLWTEVGYAYFLPAEAEEVTIDKWWRDLATPVRRKVVVEGGHDGAPPLPQANDAVGWYAPLERPTRAKRLPASAIPFEARSPLLVVPWGWYAKLDDPTRLKKTPTGQLGYTFVAAAPGAGAAYNWFSALDEPLRIRRSPKTVLNWSSYTPEPTEVVTIDKWFVELVRPTRRTKPVPQQAGYTFVAAAPGRGVAYNWFIQLDLPVRARKSPKTELGWSNYTPPPFGLASTTTSTQIIRRAIFFDRTAYSPSHTAGAGVAYTWFQPLDWPTRARKLRELPYSAIPVYFVPPTPGAGFEYNWFEPIGEPVRPRRSVRTAQQQGLTVPPQLLTVTLEYSWHQRLTEPTRRKQSLGQYPGVAQGNLSPVVPLAWQQLHTPHRVRVRINYEVPSAPYPQVELVTADKWFVELVRPIYRKRIDRPALTAGNIFPVVSYAWQQLHTPHRLKGRIEYPAFTRPVFPFNFPGTGVGTNQPWPALSEPVRFSARIRPGQQQFLSVPSLIISSDLDPACRIYEVLEFSGIIQSEGDEDVVVTPQADLVVDGPEDEHDLTPEPDDDIEVEC